MIESLKQANQCLCLYPVIFQAQVEVPRPPVAAASHAGLHQAPPARSNAAGAGVEADQQQCKRCFGVGARPRQRYVKPHTWSQCFHRAKAFCDTCYSWNHNTSDHKSGLR